MIVKPLKPPLELLQLEALNERLPVNHPLKERIEEKSRNVRAGYKGEQDLVFYLQFLPEEKYHIFHHLRIEDRYGAFQIDLLLLSSNFFLIVEVKNVRSHVIFDDMGQVFRIEDEKEFAFQHPVQQVNLQHLRLLRWLKTHHLPPIPIEKIVVYTNPSVLLKNHTNKKELPKLVMRKDSFLEKIQEFEKMYTTNKLSEKQLVEISFQLLVANIEKKDAILRKYNISYEELRKGVICPTCGQAPMIRKGGKWNCLYCGANSKNAHRTALAHYGLLVNEYINNREARDFLQLDSRHIVKKLLEKERLEKIGSRSGTRYKLEIRNLLD